VRTPRAGIALLAATLLAACGTEPPPPVTPAPVPVTTAPVTRAPVAAPVVATGTFRSRDEVPLAFKIGGVVAQVLVDEGATVRRGQLLATLDLREIEAAVAKARAGVEKAERDRDRVARLAADSVATPVQLQDATSALEVARAELQSAQVNREYATIRAPEDGLVQQRLVAAGATVAPGATILVLGGSARGRVLRAGLPDRDALRVREGDAATVRFEAIPETTFRGTVIMVGRSADPRTGTYPVELALADAGRLPSGLVGRVEIAVRAGTVASLVPVDALLEADADSATVYLVSAEAAPVATAQRVRVLQLVGDLVAVTGLPDEARVVARGAPYVRPGARVRVVDSVVAPAPEVR
jgi:RND family efflux transporter MFP subunit